MAKNYMTISPLYPARQTFFSPSTQSLPTDFAVYGTLLVQSPVRDMN